MAEQKRIISKHQIYTGYTINEYVVCYQGEYTDGELIGLFWSPWGGHVEKQKSTREGYKVAKVTAYTD